MASTYDKPFLTLEEQLDRLLERGMSVSDNEAGIRKLQAIGYYRLSGYWYPFRLMPEAHEGPRPSAFAPGTTLDDVLEIYHFDERLRVEMLQAIARIEVSLRFWVGHRLGKRGPFAHTEASELDPIWREEKSRNCTNPNCSESCSWRTSDHDGWVAKQLRVESISNEAFVAHIYSNYGQPLPVWAATETMTFETLNRLFGGMVPQDREQISVEFDLFRDDGNGDSASFSNWIEHLRQTRNYCAHHARLWNRNHTAPLAVPDSVEELKHLLASEPKPTEALPVSRAASRLYGTLTLIAYLSARIDFSNELRDRLLKLVLEFAAGRPERLRMMGFPQGWENQQIWAEEYARDSDRGHQARLLRNVELLYTGDASARLFDKPTGGERRSQLNFYRKNGAALSVPGTAAHRYPSFQFNEETGDLHEIVVLANRRLLTGGDATEENRWIALSWWISPIQIQDETTSPHGALQAGILTRQILDTLLTPRADE
ncbi:Abi family protein [Cryobacterium psychrotolerans]|nr:Abi family protein [Cryobacterium psychrotolerans]